MVPVMTSRQKTDPAYSPASTINVLSLKTSQTGCKMSTQSALSGNVTEPTRHLVSEAGHLLAALQKTDPVQLHSTH